MNRLIDYVLSEEDGLESVEKYVDSVLVKKSTAHEFKDAVNMLLADVSATKGVQSTNAPKEAFLNDIFFEKHTSTSKEATDITMEVQDTFIKRNQCIGFSIMSYMDGIPTLLNASEATNFVYEVAGLSDADMEAVNAIETKSKIIDRIERIYALGGRLEYRHTANSMFASNLMMIDSWMDRIISEMLLYYYRTNEGDCNEVITHLENANPLHYPRQGLYAYKFKKFLCAKALGMDPSKEWGGMDEANGGYIAVKSDGDVLAYHLYNRDKFEQYLLDSTHFERGSTSRHHYASIYLEGGRMYMNLNLQIRFLHALQNLQVLL